jgi:hypothetical protein
MKIQTEFQPNREWTAIDADTYEAESDSFGWWSKSPVGYGKTEQEAIDDLIDQIEDQDNDGGIRQAQEEA